jgi:hypothetical protein
VTFQGKTIYTIKHTFNRQNHPIITNLSNHPHIQIPAPPPHTLPYQD